MEKINPNDPAFPTHILVRDKFGGDPHPMTKYPGVSIRTQIAAMAMQGILSNPNTGVEQYDPYHASVNAVKYADALIEELNKEK